MDDKSDPKSDPKKLHRLQPGQPARSKKDPDNQPNARHGQRNGIGADQPVDAAWFTPPMDGMTWNGPVRIMSKATKIWTIVNNGNRAANAVYHCPYHKGRTLSIRTLHDEITGKNV